MSGSSSMAADMDGESCRQIPLVVFEHTKHDQWAPTLTGFARRRARHPWYRPAGRAGQGRRRAVPPAVRHRVRGLTMGVKVKARERKPPWLHRLCADGAGAMLRDVLCEGCGHYVRQCRDGVWETWDPRRRHGRRPARDDRAAPIPDPHRPPSRRAGQPARRVRRPWVGSAGRVSSPDTAAASHQSAHAPTSPITAKPGPVGWIGPTSSTRPRSAGIRGRPTWKGPSSYEHRHQ